jgi:Neocarzinostatin family
MAAPAGAAATTALSVQPSTGLVDNQTVSVVVTGGSAGSVYVVAECDPGAFTLLAKGESPSDACDSRDDAVIAVDAGGAATVNLKPHAVLTTALGSSDCRSEQCFIAVESQFSTGGSTLLVQDISFASTACASPKACALPADGWDPSLNAGPSATATAAPAPATTATSRASKRPATPGSPVSFPITAGQAGSLTASGSVTGPYGSAFPAPVVPTTPVSGEGLLRLALTAPHTSWSKAQPSSTVVDVTLTDLTTSTTVGTQQFVLYAGTAPFTYAGFTGPATTADAYQVTVSAEASQADGGQSWPAGSSVPTAKVVDSQLEVVDPTNPQYLATAYAPVMYGRSTSALHDVPLVVDATATPTSGGATNLSYTFIWSHEDAGTGFVPFLESGTWGRMTDIENAMSFTVNADGSTSNASYLWGGEPATGFPDSQGALQEVDEPFNGQWDGNHPVLRDATGNNDFSTAGTTPFRFQLAPVPGPAAGQTRESVMDANPFTYQISGEEVDRWYTDVSTSTQSLNIGDMRQYATIDLNASGTGVTSLPVELQLSGGPTWYASDFGTGYPANGTGHYRTMVKLPLGWQSQTITGVRLLAYPASSASSVVVHSLTVLALQSDWSLTTQSAPTPTVVAGATTIPTQIHLASTSGTTLNVKRGKTIKQLKGVVTDAIGEPLVGAAVTFTSSSPGVVFASCSCSTETVLTGTKGKFTSGAATVPATPGPVVITAATGDTVTPTVTYNVNVS